jgi:hypothetical protein
VYNTHVENGLARRVRRIFQHKFQAVTPPCREIIFRIVSKLIQSYYWSEDAN